MPEFVEREMLKEAISADCQHLFSFDSSLYELFMIDIDEIPSADVVEVVRCRECKHWCEWGACGHPDNGYDAPSMGPNDFCSKGKKEGLEPEPATKAEHDFIMNRFSKVL